MMIDWQNILLRLGFALLLGSARRSDSSGR
jgi:hypothetical protein